MAPRSVILLLLLSLFSTFTFAKPGWHLIETEDEDTVGLSMSQESKPDDMEEDKKGNDMTIRYDKCFCNPSTGNCCVDAAGRWTALGKPEKKDLSR